ncbi:CASP-like protein 3A1 isoform X1 [Carya illinoinensis]|uniref:CASP-like protein 3A1 isoform X1 n=1 Tax=Carya illinoinensis TaxID=32201 RepID=UPI001C722771|nr:CASP-like protein 3A1 isoform X1 [Carya illinoinensis]XP_042968003.1 CASP-like protein 3A1 isoform X1 [Carya illinoinensis]
MKPLNSQTQTQTQTHRPTRPRVHTDTLVSDQKTPEAKVSSVESGRMMSGPLVETRSSERKGSVVLRRSDLGHLVLRLLCMLTSVAALSFMVTAKEASTVSIYGFQLPVYSKWSFSHSFEYVVVISAAVAAHSLLQLLISSSSLLRKSSVILSRNHAWLIFAADQVKYCRSLSLSVGKALAYAMLSAASAATGVTNLNRTGIRHTALPNFCKPLHSFCDHVAISIAFTFFSCILLAASAVQDVIWLSNN